jgi:hypothetical protein
MFVGGDDPAGAAAVREIDLQKKFHLRATALAQSLGLIPAALIGDSFLGFANQLISDSRLAFGGISDASSDPCARRFHGV